MHPHSSTEVTGMSDGNRIKCVFSDMDNTLLDFRAARMAACRAVIARLGDGDPDELFRWFRRGVFNIEDLNNIADYLKYLSVYSDGLYAECAEIYETVKTENIFPYPGVSETVDEIRSRGIAFAVVTDAAAVHAEARLSRIGIFDRIDCLVTADMTGLKKPDPGIFRFALSKMGLSDSPEHAVFIGDSLHRDIAPSKAAGMRTAFALYGGSGDDPYAEGPSVDIVLEKYGDILKLL